jgi:DNA-binding NarL/FixJ family response regulator
MRELRARCDAELMALRVLLVDDNAEFLLVARSSLSRDGVEVVGSATSSADALEQTFALRPDIVLVDIGLGEESGFDLALKLVDAVPSLRSGVILISTRSADEVADLVATSPAVGFISKSELSPRVLRERFP